MQEIVNQKLSLLLKEKIETTGAGRTDTGVHALFFVAHFDSGHPNLENNHSFLYHINQVLPYDIAIKQIIRVENSAHARFDAIDRTYKYFIHHEKDPFLHGYSLYLSRPPDIKLLNLASDILLEYNDFSSFAKLHSDVNNYLCTIYHAKWNYEGKRLVFTIRANRFLRDMVRAITSTILDVGFQKITIDRFKMIIESCSRSNASGSAPAYGLYLSNISYPACYRIPENN